MNQKTVKITITGEPAAVEAVVASMKEFLDISYISRNQRLHLNPDHVHRSVRAVPLVIEEKDDNEEPL
jgi:hypothetical protein